MNANGGPVERKEVLAVHEETAERLSVALA